VQQRYGFDDAISVPARHDAFIESGVWRETCTRQIEFSVARFWRLAKLDTWDEAVRAIDS